MNKQEQLHEEITVQQLRFNGLLRHYKKLQREGMGESQKMKGTLLLIEQVALRKKVLLEQFDDLLGYGSCAAQDETVSAGVRRAAA